MTESIRHQQYIPCAYIAIIIFDHLRLFDDYRRIQIDANSNWN